MEKGRNKKVMKSSMKKLLALFVCICMLMSGSVYAQEKGTESQDASDLKAQEAVENAEAQEQSGEAKAEGQTPSEASKSQEKQKEETKPERQENKAKKTKDAKQAASAVGSVAINETNFPDANFRDYVKENFDETGEGTLSESERNKVTDMNVSGYQISDLTGIEHFAMLEMLYCDDNKLTALNVSANTELTDLHCGNNQLTTLDVSNNTKLKNINCGSNNDSLLKEIKIGNNENLIALGCEGNKLKTLDISNCTKLETLNCSENELTVLNVSNSTGLMNLACGGNKLTGLNVSNNTKLKELACDHNKLTVLNVSANTELTDLYCGNNQLMTLNVNNNTKLKLLDCSSNCLTVLKLDNNKNLGTLNCSENPLTSLDVRENIELITLECNDNKLEKLDVDKNTKLKWLYCFDNQLTSLDVRNCTELIGLGVRPLAKEAVKYLKEPSTFVYGLSSSTPVNEISISANPAEVKPETSEIDAPAIYKRFGIGENTVRKIDVEQKTVDPASQNRITNYAEKFGDTVLNVYDVSINLYKDEQYYATITEGFGKLTLSLYAGKEYAGKTAVVYQLHEKTDGTNEVIPYKNLTIDKNGMVTITVTKLSTFAVALQNTDGGASPKTGDSANMAVWIVLAVLAMALIPVVIGRRQKR